ncbi:universal stress protein [Amycolatopsis sp. FBCC-B4732]|uniref:universal stress protein n=1 Tax=Amycolatopsis sp. FBCC-B4732 TaxID=3079339 RepID=UPI001FF5B969|nr:universal stress protein [Amycolatopsis sp. FBCC-B4732]UOX90652.1 universal stress protein [Amycolatopsis sp. FBCC-B4732]
MSIGRVIVVGTDGTPRGDAALRWALEIGAHAGDTVRAILVRPRDTLLPGTSFTIQPHGRVPEAGYSLDEHMRELGISSAAAVETRTVHGDPATELVTASADADLLVLGTHRGGVMADLVLGSVGRECVRYSRCPVVVITPEAAHRLAPA